MELNSLYVEQNITNLYKVGKGGEFAGATVLKRRSSQGNTHVTVADSNGTEWKLSQYWNARKMGFTYTATKVAAPVPAEQVVLSENVGGVTLILRRVVDVYFVELVILGDTYTEEPPFRTLAEAKVAFQDEKERLIAEQVQCSEMEPEPEPIGFDESRRPYLY